MDPYKRKDENNRLKSLNSLLQSLSTDQKKILFLNIGINDWSSLDRLYQVVAKLIDEHVIIFDGKKSLFFKRTGKQCWLKTD